jgi:putative ABC transport system permease protein
VTRTWIALWSRGLRSEPARSLGVAVLVLVTVLIASSVPRVLARASDDSLHGEVASAASPVRNLELVQDGRIEAGDSDPLRLVDTAGIALESRFPAPLPAVIASDSAVVDTPLWHPSAGTPLDSVLNLRIQEGVDAHLRLDAGRLPTGATSLIPDPTPGASKDSQLTVVEGMMPSETAAKLQLPIGGRLILQPEPSDPLGASRGVRMAVDLVGTYQVNDPADPFWVDDPSVAHSYIYALRAQVEYVGGTILLAPEAYPALMSATRSSGLPMIYRWRSYVSAGALDADDLDSLASAIRRAETIYPPANPSLNAVGAFNGPDEMSPAALQTGLLGLVTSHQARWQSGATILTILWTGAGLVILASLALVAETIARRRQSALAVVGRRGASARQVAAAILSESAILVLPAAAIGVAAAVLLVPVRNQAPTVAVAGAVTIGAVTFIALASRRNRGAVGPERAVRSRRIGSGRLVAEALVVGLAIVGAVLLRGRTEVNPTAGTSATPGATVAAGADPFLAAAPALVGLAAGVIAVRLLPLVLGLVGRVAARGRGLTTVLGVRRAARDGGVAAVLVVALTASTVGAFASVLIDQLDAGARSAAWQTVGADFQVSGLAPYLAGFQAHPPAGVEAMAAVATVDVSLSTGGSRTLVALDPAEAEVVAQGTPADPEVPAEMLAPTATGPLPVIASTSTEGSSPITLGQTFSVRVGGIPVKVQAVAVRDGYPSVPPGRPFVVISSRQLAALPSFNLPAQTELLVRAPSVEIDAIQAAAAGQIGLTVQGRAATEAALSRAPAVEAVSLGILSAAIAVLVYGLLTIILAIALDTASRRRETARLQILGLSNRQTIGLVAVEFVPAVVVGVLAGVGLGLGLIGFVGPGLGLPAVLGVAQLQASSPDIGRLVGLAVLLLALIVCATLTATVVERQTQLATAVRD